MAKRVIVGMSGGVDSSVAAVLLKKQGYDVIGITLQLLPKENEKVSACCNLGAIQDAKRVCARLNIPHYTANSRNVFEEKVIDHFVDHYLNGLTPNPCVECNRHIKFDELMAKANDLDADFVATGHYVRRDYDKKSESYMLKKGVDDGKDQSYFMYMLNSDQLTRLLFPLGSYTKQEIRNIAKDSGLINADKADSQEICFVAGKSYRSFIEERLGDSAGTPGDIVDMDGNILGRHDGIYRYTVGQRRGVNVGSQDPLYVLKIDSNAHRLVVGPQDILKRTSISLTSFTLVNPKDSVIGHSFGLKLRYQMTDILGIVRAHSGDTADVELMSGETFIASGQSCVIYDKDRVVGGGVIADSFR